jgi:glucosamine-6-phosphate deaminase
MPFYKTGRVRKDPITQDDVDIVMGLMNDFRPDHIYVAGDLSDPHGTHRMCYFAIREALNQYNAQEDVAAPNADHSGDGAAYPAPHVWLYRGAWQEWEVDRADVFMPMSKADLDRKIEAIFKHESQKDRAMFPGAHDTREFWERARDRNTQTAEQLNDLGLPEFYAAEAYVTGYEL